MQCKCLLTVAFADTFGQLVVVVAFENKIEQKGNTSQKRDEQGNQ